MSKLIYATEEEYANLNFEDRESLKNDVRMLCNKYLKNPQRTYNKYINFLCTEFIKYNKVKESKSFFILFETLILQYKNSNNLNSITFFRLLAKFFTLSEKASNNYLMIAMNEHSSEKKSKYDELYHYMNMLGELLEKCTYKNLTILLAILHFDAKLKEINNIEKLNFGTIINNLQNLCSNNLLAQDSFYEIPLNHLRNICVHKNYELVSSTKVSAQYIINKLTISKEIEYSDILKILKYQNLLNTTIKLFLSLVYLDNMIEIQPLIKEKTNIRLENSLLYLFLNLRSVGFRILKYALNKETNNFELFFEDIKDDRDTNEAIIHLSQAFSHIASCLYDDKIANINPQNITIYLYFKNCEIANAIISYSIALNFCLNKIQINDLIKAINFEIKLDKHKT